VFSRTVSWLPKTRKCRSSPLGLPSEHGIDFGSVREGLGTCSGHLKAVTGDYLGYCDREMERRFDRQSIETDQQERRRLVWEIDKKSQEDAVRPIIAHMRWATCWQPYVKGS
jgi:hypothetical protein